MIRARFQANADDYRPIKWPPPGPYWCTGYAGDESHSIVVAYVESVKQLREFWPEAADITTQDADAFIFTDRFPRPDWWPADRSHI